MQSTSSTKRILRNKKIRKKRKLKKFQIKRKIAANKIFSSFPDVLLAEIFSYLHFDEQLIHIKLVSHHFHQVVSLPNACPSTLYLYNNTYLSSLVHLPFKYITMSCPTEHDAKLLQQMKSLSSVEITGRVKTKDLLFLDHLPITHLNYDAQDDTKVPDLTFFESLSTLHTFNLWTKTIGLSQLALLNLSSLKISVSSLLDQNLPALPKLRYLQIDSNNFNNSTTLQNLPLETLKLLSQSQYDISPLKYITTITDLTLTTVDKIIGLEVLGELPLLKEFSLYSFDEDDDLIWLQQLKHLERLILSVSYFSDFVLSYMTEMPLRYFGIRFDNSDFTGDGFAYLPLTLEEFRLSSRFSDSLKISEFSALGELRHLTELELEKIDLSSIQFPSIPTLTYLKLDRVLLDLKQLFPYFPRLTSLELDLFVTDEWILSLPIMPLEDLALWDGEKKLTDIGLKSLKKFKTLRNLYLKCPNMTNKCVAFLRKKLPLADIRVT